MVNHESDRLHKRVTPQIKLPTSWREIFDSNHKSWGHMGMCCAHAYDGGYKFFCWNGRIYHVYGDDTGLTVDDILCVDDGK